MELVFGLLLMLIPIGLSVFLVGVFCGSLDLPIVGLVICLVPILIILFLAAGFVALDGLRIAMGG